MQALNTRLGPKLDPCGTLKYDDVINVKIDCRK